MPPVAKPLWQRFVLFLLPLMLSNILQSLSGTINSIYLGQMIGVEALAAAALFFPIFFFLMSFVIGLSSGATVLIGQAWGARNMEKLKQVTGTTLTVSFLAGLVVAVIGGTFTEQIMRVLGAPPDILPIATAYGRVFLIGIPAFFLFLVATSLLRGVGDTVTPLISLFISIAVGLVTTPALIQGWLGLPQLGATAAAVGGVMSFLSVLVFLAIYLPIRGHALAPDAALLRNLRIHGPTLVMVLRLGVPAGVQMVVSSISGIVIIGLINRFGSDATAAYGAVNQVLSYVQFPAMSIAIAASIFGAQAIGARQSGQLGAITRTALVMNLVLTGSLILIAYLFSESIVRLFITDPAVVDVTQQLLHIMLWSIVCFGAASVLSGIMRASGTVLVPMLIALGCIVLIEMPGAIILSQVMGLEGIYVAYAATFTGMLVLQALYYWFVWRGKTVVALV